MTSSRDDPTVAECRWGPSPWAAGAAAGGLVAAVVWWLVDARSEDRVVASVLAVVALVVGVVLLRTKVRLGGTTGGLTVIGPLHRREIPWQRVAQISTPRRGRFGRNAAALELEIWPEPPGYDDVPADTGAADTDLLVFGSFELGTDPAEVAPVLMRLRAGHRPGVPGVGPAS